jgi:LacI family transcriptional regulator
LKKVAIALDFAGGYGRAVLRGVMHVAQLAHDWEFVMPPMYALAKRRGSFDADGVISMVHHERTLASLRRAEIPIVNTARTLSLMRLRAARLHSVIPNDEAVGRMAYTYFRDRGFTQFAFCGHPTSDWSLARGHAFAASAAADGFPCHSIARADHVPVRWVSELPRPVGLLAANDRYAWHALDACRSANLRIPDDIAILGVDNDELMVEMARPTLSSIELPGFAIGVAAANLLLRLMSGESVAPEPQILAPEAVISRASTDVLRIDDDAVVDAIRFIRASASRPVSVDDVLDAVPLSRRNLERRFRTATGRSLLEEIRRVHIDRAKRLLRETSLSMPDVARESGFQSAVRFSTVFGDVVGVPPTIFRQQHLRG